MALQEYVYNNLEDKQVLEKIGRNEFGEMIVQGFITGGYVNERLVALRAMYIPPLDDPEHLALDGGIENRKEVIYSEISFIHPDSRGRGLQTELGKELIGKVRKDGRFKYIMTTVMPTNIPSLKDKFRLGFKIVNTRVMYGGKDRHVLQLNLAEPIQVGDRSVKISYKDVPWMMDNGKNHIGSHFDGSEIDYHLKSDR